MKLDLDEIDAVATIHFGLPYGEGRKLTPRQFNKLQEQYKIRQRIESSRPALICATLANINRSKGTKAFTVEDFMGNEKRRMTSEQIKAALLPFTKK